MRTAIPTPSAKLVLKKKRFLWHSFAKSTAHAAADTAPRV